MKLEWIGTSLSDLASIRNYIAERNPAAADRIAHDIDKAAQFLKPFPNLGRPTYRSDIRLLQVPNLPYLLPYRVNGEIIEILAVFDERRERPDGWL